MSNPQSKGAIKKQSKIVRPPTHSDNLSVPTTSRRAAAAAAAAGGAAGAVSPAPSTSTTKSTSTSTSKATSSTYTPTYTSTYTRRDVKSGPIEITVGRRSKGRFRGGRNKAKPKPTPSYRADADYSGNPPISTYQAPACQDVAISYADVVVGEKTERSPALTTRTKCSFPAQSLCKLCNPKLQETPLIPPPPLANVSCWDMSEKIVFKFKSYSAEEVIELSDDSSEETEPPRPSLNLEPPSPIQQLFSESYSVHSWLGLDTQHRRYPLQQRDPLDQLLVSLQNLRLNRSPTASVRDAVERFIAMRREDPENSFAAAQNACLQWVLNGPPDEILISKFGLKIRRSDMYSVIGQNWLNDLVIDFYMNLLIERSQRKYCTHGYPRVYAMNPYFMTNLVTRGYESVMRYTRRVDIFQMDVIPVPVYMGEQHWAMGIIHLKNRIAQFYDPRGYIRMDAALLLKEYVLLEAVFKLRPGLYLNDMIAESPTGLPTLKKCYDSGVYACMFAEHMTAKRTTPFQIENVQYLRNKMIVEILQGRLYE